MQEWADFQNLWEQRLLSMAVPYLDPSPELDSIEGSAAAVFADGATLTVGIQPNADTPPTSGYWLCDVYVQYAYERSDDQELVSQTWGQILQAFGDGYDGSDPLRDRLRINPGRTVIPNGRDVIMYDRPITSDSGRIKELGFTAYLGIARLAAS